METGIIQTEETLVIETPERVPIEFSIASIGNRFLAVLVDHVIQIVVYIVIAAAGAWLLNIDQAIPVGEEVQSWVLVILIIVVSVLFSGYFVVFEWLWNGQTPGKRLMKLRVIREDGRPVVFWEALTRNIIRIFDALPGGVVPIYSVGLITIFLSKRDQRFGDFFAGTLVIRESKDDVPTFDDTFAEEISDSAMRRVQPVTAFTGDISLISEADIEIVESFLRRRWELVERQRQWMAWRIGLPLMFRLKPGYDSKTFTYEGFLEELFHRYNAQGKRF